ncbi:MAG: transposase zinc-binding domain-containing protein [Bdellovibrionales bacterium]|nr:transposase zinc-binding domain-containing protein [Bdellovibrionales bacterium]
MVERAPKPFQSFKEFQYKGIGLRSLSFTDLQENLETFLERFQLEMGHPLPAFVTKEFYDYLNCGILANGFLRVQCEKCHHENLVAFSCKHRGFCPSCGARRMVETAAHLVDYVLPDQPIRQFVLTFPFQLRPLLAVRPKIMSACLEISHRATTAFLLKKAGLSKTTGVIGGVTLIQRFGGACNVNVRHFRNH